MSDAPSGNPHRAESPIGAEGLMVLRVPGVCMTLCSYDDQSTFQYADLFIDYVYMRFGQGKGSGGDLSMFTHTHAHRNAPLKGSLAL